MVLRFLKEKWEKIIVSIVFTLIALILILSLVINLYWSPILASKVKEVVLKSSNGLYKVDFSSADLHVLRGTIVIFNINLRPDTAVYNLRKQQHLAPNNLVQLRVKRLTLSSIHPFKLYFQHKLEIGEIELSEPQLDISYQLNHTKDTVVKDNQTAWQKISKSLHSINIGKIMLGDIKLKYEDYSGNKLAISELKQMNITASSLLIDSATQTDKSRLLYCKEIVVELNDYTGKSPNGLYTYKINHLKLSTQKSQLNAEGLTLTPIDNQAFFAKSNKARFTARLDSLQMNNFDFLSYHKYRTLTASKLRLNNGSLAIFGNPNHHQDSTDKVRSFPNFGLYKINADMKIDSIDLHHINVTYSEYNRKSYKTGSIYFNNTSAHIINVTTNKAALQKNNICNVKLTSYFMNRARLNAALTFNLTDQSKSFSYKGELGPMDLKDANSAIIPLAMVKITSGTLKQIKFDVNADRYRANGKVKVLYNDLKVSIFKPDTINDKLRHRPIETFYANLFILKHNNPDATGEDPREIHVDYLRNTTETPFFKYIWQTLLSGIKPSVGFDKKTEEATKELKAQREINKQNRKIKKEERIKRREERREKREEKKALKAEEKSASKTTGIIQLPEF
jgi:hypothetical protein